MTMPARPRLLDLFCGAGGAAMGYMWAGFDVLGVDIEPQRRYPFLFVQTDALRFVARNGKHFDAIHASPPCQRYTALGSVEDLTHYPDLVAPTRDALEATGKPWVMENVVGAPMRADATLCGAMFGLRSYRHRLFESNVPISAPEHPKHVVRVNRRGENRKAWWDAGGFITVTGDIGRYVGPEAMGIDWMTGNELSQAIPPYYTNHIGQQVAEYIRERWRAIA